MTMASLLYRDMEGEPAVVFHPECGDEARDMIQHVAFAGPSEQLLGTGHVDTYLV